MSWDFSQFHFIRPWLLLALPAVWVTWFLIRFRHSGTVWENHISGRLLAVLRVAADAHTNWWRWILLLGWTICIVGAAGPTWQKLPVPVVKNQHAMVILLDLSPSMLATDLKPNRLTLAKYKIIDILRLRGDGQSALVVYAGDAHTVTPLTDDPNSIEALLPALHPSIMPETGSNVEKAIELALWLLRNAQITSADILLISDGIAPQALSTIRDIMPSSVNLSILSVGGSEPAPFPATSGGFVKRADGEIVLSAPNVRELSQLASDGGGQFSELRSDNSDIDRLLKNLGQTQTGEDSANPDSGRTDTYDSWADMGHWLVMLVLPFALLCFRKGVIYLLPLCLFFPPESQAIDPPGTATSSGQVEQAVKHGPGKYLWSTPDQQAAKLLEQQQMQAAAQTFQRDDWAGVASFRDGDFESAVERFSKNDDVTSQYNRANAQAFSGELEEAIATYEQVLEQQADHADASHNKDVVEKLLEQQQQQQGNEQQQGDPGEQDQSEEDQNPQSKGEDSEDQQESSESTPEQSEQPNDSDNEPGDENSSDQAEQENPAEPKPPEQPDADSQNDDKTEEPETEQAEGEQAEQQQTEQDSESQQEGMMPDETNSEPLQDSSEQWLRSIQEDPGGYLRRKFEDQATQRQGQQQKSAEQRY